MSDRVLRAIVIAVVGAAASLLASASLADIDATGRWVIRGPWGVYLAYEIEDWIQTGTAVTTSDGYIGTISPTTGVINMTRTNPICPNDTRTGTVAADGLSLTGFEMLHPTYSPTSCFSGVGANITGSRCPSGTIEGLEECDDGNVNDGDGCDNTCAVEHCWTCAGTPSACSPIPGCSPVCQNGMLEVGEECDDGNDIDGDGCDADCQLEPCWTCVGTVCSPQAQGTPCDAQDGIACTSDGACDAAHHCIETPDDALCNDSDGCTIDTCNPLTGCVFTPKSCDDGNPCTVDSCSGDCVHNADVRLDCRAAVGSKLVLKTSANGRDKLVWTWTRGQSTSPAELADPLASASYRLCVFAGAANHTIATASLPPSASLWQSTPKGFDYDDPDATVDGIARLKLISSDHDRAKIGLKGKGAGLDLAAPPVGLPITAQLLNSQSSVCWTASYDAGDVRKNEAGKLSVRASGP